MELKLNAMPEERAVPSFPYANWGAATAIAGFLIAIGAGLLLGIPPAIIGHESDGELTTFGNVGLQLATAIGFLSVPIALAARRSDSLAEALRRLGVRRFRLSALKWMAATVGAYLLFSAVYITIVGEPTQDDIADAFGALPVQILLIAILAPISEEILFRGMLFGGLRTQMPRIAAALLSGIIFGSLHALTGLSAVPVLIFFGFVMALLYERTGSIVPCILLHMLNNSAALLAK